MPDLICSNSGTITVLIYIFAVIGLPCAAAHIVACIIDNGKAEQLRRYKAEEEKQNAEISKH